MDHSIALTDAAVWRYWELAPSSIELTVRRVKWYQEWVNKNDENLQVLAIMFGNAAFEPDLAERGGS